MSRIARHSPGIERNIPRPGHAGPFWDNETSRKFSGAQFADFAVIFFKNQKVKIQQNIYPMQMAAGVFRF